MLGANYPTKKVLKAEIGKPLKYTETSMFEHGCVQLSKYVSDGTFCVVGPDAFNNRKWFASVTMKDGVITKVT